MFPVIYANMHAVSVHEKFPKLEYLSQTEH